MYTYCQSWSAFVRTLLNFHDQFRRNYVPKRARSPSPELDLTDGDISPGKLSPRQSQLAVSFKSRGINDDLPSPSWFDDDGETDVFQVAETPPKFDPCSTSTQLNVSVALPKSFSPVRSGLKSLLQVQKYPVPLITTSTQPPKPTYSFTKQSPSNTPPLRSHPDPTQPHKSVSKHVYAPPNPADGVCISPDFHRAINVACDTIQAMPLQKLIACFDDKIICITGLLSEWTKNKEVAAPAASNESIIRPSISRKVSSAQEGEDAQYEIPQEMYDGMGSWNEGDFIQEPGSMTSEPPPTTKPVQLHLPPTVELITRSKPNQPKLEVDTGEGNAFLPLASNQSKWGKLQIF